MGHFFGHFFKVIFVILDISMACDISFYAFFPNNYDGNEDISFQDPPGPRGGGIFPFFKVNFRGPMKWDLSLLIYPWHVTYHFTVFSLIKTMEISKFHFRTTIVQGG